MKLVNTLSILGISIGMFLLGMSIINQQEVQATGGGEVIELVIPMLDETVKSIQNNDTEKAISQLEEIKTELKDTFFAEEEN